MVHKPARTCKKLIKTTPAFYIKATSFLALTSSRCGFSVSKMRCLQCIPSSLRTPTALPRYAFGAVHVLSQVRAARPTHQQMKKLCPSPLPAQTRSFVIEFALRRSELIRTCSDDGAEPFAGTAHGAPRGRVISTHSSRSEPPNSCRHCFDACSSYSRRSISLRRPEPALG